VMKAMVFSGGVVGIAARPVKVRRCDEDKSRRSLPEAPVADLTRRMSTSEQRRRALTAAAPQTPPGTATFCSRAARPCMQPRATAAAFVKKCEARRRAAGRAR